MQQQAASPPAPSTNLAAVFPPAPSYPSLPPFSLPYPRASAKSRALGRACLTKRGGRGKTGGQAPLTWAPPPSLFRGPPTARVALQMSAGLSTPFLPPHHPPTLSPNPLLFPSLLHCPSVPPVLRACGLSARQRCVWWRHTFFPARALLPSARLGGAVSRPRPRRPLPPAAPRRAAHPTHLFLPLCGGRPLQIRLRPSPPPTPPSHVYNPH